MNAAVRLALYGTGLIVAFFAAYFVAAAVVPQEYVQNWNDRVVIDEHSNEENGGH